MTLTVFIAAFVVFAIAIVGLALGSLIQGKPLKGSCGGLNNIEGFENHDCGCDSPCEKRQKWLEEQESRQSKEQKITLHH